jgi:hypothetical protein
MSTPWRRLGCSVGTSVTAGLSGYIAEAYTANVNALKASLARGDGPEVVEIARALIDKVIVYPPEAADDPPSIELIGKLMGLLAAAGVAEAQAPEKSGQPTSVLALFVSSVMSGPGAEPRPASLTSLRCFS